MLNLESRPNPLKRYFVVYISNTVFKHKSLFHAVPGFGPMAQIQDTIAEITNYRLNWPRGRYSVKSCICETTKPLKVCKSSSNTKDI